MQTALDLSLTFQNIKIDKYVLVLSSSTRSQFYICSWFQFFGWIWVQWLWNKPRVPRELESWLIAIIVLINNKEEINITELQDPIYRRENANLVVDLKLLNLLHRHGYFLGHSDQLLPELSLSIVLVLLR